MSSIVYLLGTGSAFGQTVQAASAPAAAASAPADAQSITVTGRRPGTESYRAERSTLGTKSDSRLLETPVSASVVTREFLDDTQTTTITEALRFVPGVYAGDNGRAAVDENISVRGFSYLRSTFVDGTRQQAYNIDVNPEPYGLERIEVLRGSAAVLYGSTQPGGIVNSVSRRPQRVFGAEVMLSGGSLDLKRAGFDITGPLAGDDRVAFRLTGLVRDQNDLADTAYNNRRYIAPALSWFPTPQTEVTALLSVQEDRFHLVPYLPAEGTVRANPNGSIPRERYFGEPGLPDDKVTTKGAKLLLNHRFSESLQLRHATGWRDYDRFTNYIYIDLAPGARLADRFIYPVSTKAKVLSSDTSLQFGTRLAGAQHSFTVGVDHYRIKDRSSTQNATLGPIDAFAPVYGQTPVLDGTLSSNGLTTLEQTGLYLQDQIRWGPWVGLIGARRDSFKLEAADPVSGYSDRIRDQSTTARLGVVYLAGGGWAPYASYTQGFYPQGGTDAQGGLFDAETSDQFEAGIKFESPDRRSSASAALFSITRQNVLNPDPGNPRFSIQTGEQRHRGLELEFNLGLTRAWGLLGAYTLLDAKVTKSTQFIGGQAVQGRRPANVPRQSLAVWSVYSMGKDSALPGLRLSAGLRAQSEREGDTLNTFRTPSFVVLDASVTYLSGPWRWSANLINLADKRYISATTGYSDYVRFGDGRMLVASVTRSF